VGGPMRMDGVGGPMPMDRVGGPMRRDRMGGPMRMGRVGRRVCSPHRSLSERPVVAGSPDPYGAVYDY